MNGGLHSLVVAIPARNEAELLPRCLQAIERQVGLRGIRPAVVVLANNCADATVDVVAAMAAATDMIVRCHPVTLPPTRATVGWARRLSMELAAGIAHEDGILVSTDADTVADPDWLATHLTAMTDKVSAVAGRVSSDWAELRLLPDHALEVGKLAWRWQAAAAELEALVDPLDYDPWPRHRQRSGANFAVRKTVWARTGGIPPLASGEDRAFLQTVEQAGGLVRHAPGPHVTSSARLFGRATGGTASMLAARAVGEEAIDTDIETAESFLTRLHARAALRKAHADGSTHTALGKLGIRGVKPGAGGFAALWTAIEEKAPEYRAAKPGPGALSHEVALLERALAGHRQTVAYA